MNSIEFPLYPNVKKTIIMVKIRYTVYEYMPFKYAKISVLYLDENDAIIDNKLLEMNTTNGFSNWGSDDTYLQNWIKANL
jgi:hypothetical protein